MKIRRIDRHRLARAALSQIARRCLTPCRASQDPIASGRRPAENLNGPPVSGVAPAEDVQQSASASAAAADPAARAGEPASAAGYASSTRTSLPLSSASASRTSGCSTSRPGVAPPFAGHSRHYSAGRHRASSGHPPRPPGRHSLRAVHAVCDKQSDRRSQQASSACRSGLDTRARRKSPSDMAQRYFATRSVVDRRIRIAKSTLIHADRPSGWSDPVRCEHPATPESGGQRRKSQAPNDRRALAAASRRPRQSQSFDRAFNRQTCSGTRLASSK